MPQLSGSGADFKFKTAITVSASTCRKYLAEPRRAEIVFSWFDFCLTA